LAGKCSNELVIEDGRRVAFVFLWGCKGFELRLPAIAVGGLVALGKICKILWEKALGLLYECTELIGAMMGQLILYIYQTPLLKADCHGRC